MINIFFRSQKSLHRELAFLLIQYIFCDNIFIVNKFYHRNGIFRDIVYMIGIFLNLLDTQSEKEKFIELYDTYKDLLYWITR